ncbi:hypothetical protein [Epilithonimonas tenax]|uniref:hypothetical protein n=1 Tax=Epilithonimonas tenax TaxID=191577 RepID=UPI00040EF5BE|nr:hypothetical protein [Epilithonimonas tenax]
MIFDKNFLKPNNEMTYHVYQEESENADFINPYNDNPYMLSSLQKIKNRTRCQKKKAIINACLDAYSNDLVENPEINIFKNPDQISPSSSFAAYAKSSYQKVLKDLENIQKLIDKLDVNEPDTIRIIS